MSSEPPKCSPVVQTDHTAAEPPTPRYTESYTDYLRRLTDHTLDWPAAVPYRVRVRAMLPAIALILIALGLFFMSFALAAIVVLILGIVMLCTVTRYHLILAALLVFAIAFYGPLIYMPVICIAILLFYRPCRKPIVYDLLRNRRCLHCGYSLRGLLDGTSGVITCPECGREADLTDYRWRKPYPRT